jgi:hypothetical protein
LECGRVREWIEKREEREVMGGWMEVMKEEEMKRSE